MKFDTYITMVLVGSGIGHLVQNLLQSVRDYFWS